MKIIDWNRMTIKVTMMEELKREMRKLIKILSLKVVLLQPIDYIAYYKIMKTI